MLSHSMMKKCNASRYGAKKTFLKKFFIYPIAKLFGAKFWLKKHEKLVKSFKMSDYDFCNLYAGVIGTKEVFPKKYFDDLIEVDFEGHKLKAIAAYDDYLTNAYGDYMQLPPEEYRVSLHDFVIYKKNSYIKSHLPTASAIRFNCQKFSLPTFGAYKGTRK